MSVDDTAKLCPCCSGALMSACCAPVIAGLNASSPLALMRSRYTAFTQNNLAYIEKTMKGPALKSFLNTKNTPTCERGQAWKKLEIIDTPLVKKRDKQGVVEFIATYEIEGIAHHLHERSRFIKIANRWFYVDGQIKSP